MIELAKVIKCSVWVMSISWFFVNGCMIEDLSYGIFTGCLDSVTEGIRLGEKLNDEIYCKQIKMWIKPLLLAIKCLSKVKHDDKKSLEGRFAIIELLIQQGAKIDKGVYQAIEMTTVAHIKAKLNELVSKFLEDEFVELSKCIEHERNNATHLDIELLDEDDFVEIEGIKRAQFDTDFNLIDDYCEIP